MTIIHAVRTAEGIWTGAQYSVTSPAIRAHHRQYGEVLQAVAALRNAGSDDAPDWQAVPADPLDLRAALTIGRYQLRAALLTAGHFAQVDAAMQAHADALIREAWDSAQSYRRLSPMLAAIGDALGLSDAQLDDLIRAAAEIEA